MKKMLLVLGCSVLMTGLSPAETKPAAPATEKKAPAKAVRLKWYTTLKSAQKAAVAEKKPILMLFTGSDWCPFCVKLEKGYLSTPEFSEWASTKVILLLVDSKGGPGRETADGKPIRAKFADKAGYPTIIFSDGEGNVLGKTGYREQPVADYIKHLDGIAAKATKPDAAAQ